MFTWSNVPCFSTPLPCNQGFPCYALGFIQHIGWPHKNTDQIVSYAWNYIQQSFKIQRFSASGNHYNCKWVCCIYTALKNNVDYPEGAKYFFPIWVGQFILLKRHRQTKMQFGGFAFWMTPCLTYLGLSRGSSKMDIHQLYFYSPMPTGP